MLSHVRAKLKFAESKEAIERKKSRQPQSTCLAKPDDAVNSMAKENLQRLGGDINDRTQLLGQYELQFGTYKGLSFLWLLNNSLGYAAYIANSVKKETTNNSPLSKNKTAFLEYIRCFPEGRKAMLQKEQEQERKKSNSGTVSATSSSTATRTVPSTVSTASPSTAAMISGTGLSPQLIARRIMHTPSHKGPRPNTSRVPGKVLYLFFYIQILPAGI